MFKKQTKQTFWQKLWDLLELSQTRIKIIFLITALLELTRLIGPYLLKVIIDTLTDFSVDKLPVLLWLATSMFVAEEFQAVISWYFNRYILHTLIEIEYYIPIDAQKKFMSLSLGYHERENTGAKIIKVQRGVDHISNLVNSIFWEVGSTVMQLIVTLFILFFIDFRFGLVFLFFVPQFIALTYKVNKELQSKRETVHKLWESSAGKMGQAVVNINTVQSFVQENREIRDYKDLRLNIKDLETATWNKLFNYVFGRDTIINIGRICMIAMGGWLASLQLVTIGTLVFVITVSEKSFFSLYRLSRFYDRIQNSVEAVDRFIDLAKEEPDIKNPHHGLKPKNFRGEIMFDRVTFSYDDTHKPVLQNVNFHIRAGTTNALVGPSGGGKTTIARMIYRHYDPQKGAVLFDGHDLRLYDLYHFRKAIAIVPQEVEIFNASVRENIAYANSKANGVAIKRAARIANADGFINALKDGYDSVVGERGIKLSGGQRQRIGIARAILADPKILIFDEATSNLDSRSERLIQEAMERVAKSRTVIIIAHRLSTIRHADQIFVFEDGKIVEKGNHTELSDVRGGLYAKLLKLQQAGDVN